MKELAILMACLFFYQFLMAQTWSEWFRQHHTQLRYLEEQIAALREYNVVQVEGYVVDDVGLQRIDTTEESDYGLHDEYFLGLRKVATAIARDPRILTIVSTCEKTLAIIGIIRLSAESKGATELAVSMREWFANMTERSLDSLTERLADLMTPGILQMSDAERERGIGDIASQAGKINSDAVNYLEFIMKS